MASAALGSAFRHFRDLFGSGSVVGLEDGPLLARYSRSNDPAAFEALVGRHGPMVLATCRAVLRNEHDVEDAFQATFLVLARKADSVRGGEGLGAWLHRVAYRASVQASIEAKRRRRIEAEAALVRSGPAREESDRLVMLHEEIERLPRLLRLAVVLCDLEGLSYEEAAGQLGWTVPTLRHRLANARQKLKGRLAGREGVPASLGVALVAKAPAALPPALVRSVVASATGGSASAGVLLLTHTISRGMLMTKIKTAGLAAVAGLALASAGVIATAGGGRPPVEGPNPAPKPKAEAAVAPKPASEKPGELVEVKGLVVAPDGRPVAGAAVRGFTPERDVTSFPEATSGPDGRFTIRIPKLKIAMSGFTSPYPWLVASAPGLGLGWSERALRDDRPAEQVVTLTTEAPPIEGRVVDLEGRPVAGASVRTTTLWYDESGKLPAWIAKARNGAQGNLWQGLQNFPVEKLYKFEAKTDADGRFKLTGIGPDRVAQLLVSGPGVATTQVHAFSRAEAEIRSVDRAMIGSMPFIVHAPRFQLALMPGRRVEGIARDKDSGQPIAGLALQAAVFSESSLIPDPGVEARTDAEGRYRLDGLARAAAYQLFIRPEKGLPYVGSSFKVAAGKPGPEAVAFDFALKRGVVVRGKITDKDTGRKLLGYANYYAAADNPNLGEFPGFSRSLRQNAYFGDDGGYEIVVLPGPGLIAVHEEEGRYRPAAGADKIRGYDPKSKAIRTSSFYVSPGGQAIIAEVDADPKLGPITLGLQADPGKSVAVEVVDPDGRPLGGTKVKGMSEMYATMPYPQDASGFEIHALDPARPRRVVIQHDARKLIGTAFVTGNEVGTITVKLAPWGTVAGRIVDDEGKPRKGMFLRSPGGSENKHPETDDILPSTDWNSGVRVGDDGRFLVEGLVPGLKYAATAQGRIGQAYIGGDLFEGVTVAPGEAKDLGDVKFKTSRP